MEASQQRYYSPEEYLALEATAKYKSEYIHGEILPMAGGSTNHNRIAGNSYSALNFAFKNQNYEVFISDVRLWIPESHIYTYPDAMVVVGKPEYFNQRQDTITNPQVIIEVLSKSTQEYDRSSKFRAYRTIPTFQEYVLLDQNKIYVEQFFKTGAKSWSLREYDQSDEAIALSSLNFHIPLTAAYNKVQISRV